MTVSGSGARVPTPVIPILSDEVRPHLRVGLVRAEPVQVEAASAELVREMEETERALAEEHAGLKPGAIPGLAHARELYRAFGVDPTRTRPSSEALLRRILRGGHVPRILNAVDVCNLCSLRFLLPLGLYDAANIRGQVMIRLGRRGEIYPGIRKEEVHLDGRLVLSDDAGPFGNPTSDSARTAVTSSTRSLWMVIFAPVSFPPDRLEECVTWARQALARHLEPSDETVGTGGLVV